MGNSELIDDYLSGKLNEQEKNDLEVQASADPALKADIELQKQIIEGVQKARMLELKSMLNNVPVGGSGMETFAVGKLAAGLIAAGIVGTAAWFYFTKPSQKNLTQHADIQAIDSLKDPANNKALVEVQEPIDAAAFQEKVKPVDPLTTSKENQARSNVKQKAPQDKAAGTTQAVKAQPKIDVIDPVEDMNDARGKSVPEKQIKDGASGLTASRIAVDTDSSNKKYTFHYQFTNEKLMLYGSFDKSLYEVLEINGKPKSVFLFYKGNYYLLNDRQHNITPLEPIRDQVLLRKLKEYKEQ